MATRNVARLACLFSLGVLLTVGCTKSPEAVAPTEPVEQARILSAEEGGSPTQAQIDRMIAAKDALFKRLSGRLMEVMSTQGPVAAIEVCQQEAPSIASKVSTEQGLKIGRTGVRLRNPSNQAPAWAAGLTEQKIDSPTFAMLSSGKAAALLPIKLGAQCVVCHGPKETLAPEIQSHIAKLYPDDQATGFTEGELRGWFWVESD